MMIQRGNRLRQALFVTGTALSLVSVAACGSSSSSPKASTSSPEASTSSAGTVATSSGASGSASAGGGSGLQRAEAAVKSLEQSPTTIGVTTPLTSKPAAGKTMVYLQCEVPQCKQVGDGVSAAAQALGWQYKEIAFENTNPPSLIAGLKQALQYKPVAVALEGVPLAAWQSVLPEYKAAGVPIIPASISDDALTPTVPVRISSVRDFSRAGALLGDWFVADSQGQGHAVIVDVPALASLAAYAGGITDEVKATCPDCKVTTLNATFAQADSNTIVSAAASAVQQDPSVKYVLSTDGPFTTGLPAALRAIGRGSVQISAGNPSLPDEQAVAAGSETALTGQGTTTYAGWQMVDVAARASEGMTIPQDDGGEPVQLLVKSNLGTPSAAFSSPSDYQAQFKKLWQVG